MSIRDMINKLEVLEQIITAIECTEEAYRQDAKRYQERAEEEKDLYWQELAAVAEAKADYCHSYKALLIKHEIK